MRVYDKIPYFDKLNNLFYRIKTIYEYKKQIPNAYEKVCGAIF